jgi:ribosomal protein S18 acetylase RimI-like enzyme
MGDLGSSSKGLIVVACHELGETQRLQAGALVHAALPDFYAPLDQSQANAAIANQFLELGTELHATEAAILDGVVLGIVTDFRAAELKARQSVSLHSLLSELTNGQQYEFFDHIRKLTADIPPIPTGGQYLARLAITKDQRGTGLASQLLDRFIGRVPCGGTASLHVASANARAIAFYARHGFQTISARGSVTIAMSRVCSTL